MKCIGASRLIAITRSQWSFRHEVSRSVMQNGRHVHEDLQATPSPVTNSSTADEIPSLREMSQWIGSTRRPVL